MAEGKKRRSDVISYEDETLHKRVLSQCMSHDFTMVESDERIRDYIQCIWSSDTTQLFDEFILKSRLNRILTCRPSRNNSKSIEKLWYTTTCYLSGKIIILFFTMLRLFSINVDIQDKSELTILWLIVEKMMWEIITTNSIDHRSDPPSLEMIGQTNESLGEFIRSKTDPDNSVNIRNSLLYITSVSRGDLDRCVIVDNMSDILTRDYRIPPVDCGFVNSKIPIIAGISISTSTDRTPSGIIHWFSFVIDRENDKIDIYSSWADGDYPIQSVMTKVSVNIVEFNEIIRIFNVGTNDNSDIDNTILLIAKYFFSNPPIESKDVIAYLRSVFLIDGVIMPGKFNIIIFPYYYKHCINVSNLLLETSLESPSIRNEMSSVVNISKKLYFDTNLIKLKLLLIFLYTKSGCSNSGFYLEGDFGVRGGKQKKRRKTKKRKTIKRKRRYTRRYKK
jgi:hypothetical protein